LQRQVRRRTETRKVNSVATSSKNKCSTVASGA
jgi:hypothetical protein